VNNSDCRCGLNNEGNPDNSRGRFAVSAEGEGKCDAGRKTWLVAFS